MAKIPSLTPPPTNEDDVNHWLWKRWFQDLRNKLSNFTISISWSDVSKIGSNILDIVTRNHNDLQNIQGGSIGDYQHLTTAHVATLDAKIGGTGTVNTIAKFISANVLSASSITDDGTNIICTEPITTTRLNVSNKTISPTIDSTTALQITKADGTTVIFNVDTTNGYIGFGGSAPTNPMFLKATFGPTFVSEVYSTSLANNIQQRRAKGTIANPLPLSLANDIIGQNSFTGAYDNGSGVGVMLTTANASMRILTEEPWTTTAQGAYFRWVCVAAGTTTPPVTTMEVHANRLQMSVSVNLRAGTATAGTSPIKFAPGTLLTAPENGSIEYDGDSLHFTPMGTARKTIMLSSDVAIATITVANTLTETDIFSVTLAANELTVSKVIQIQAYGRYSTVNGVDTWTARVYIGATVVATINSAAANVTNTPFDAKCIFTCRSSGVTGTVWSYARVSANKGDVSVPGTATTTVDTTASQVLKVTVQWSSANAGNTFSLDQGYREVIDT